MIAGQGTIAMEILRQLREPIDAIFVAVGGGGLIGGIAAYVKRLRPEIRIIGVEPADADAMERSLRGGPARHALPRRPLRRRRRGQAGRRGDVPPRRRHVDEMILVDTDEICAAIKDVFEDTRAIVEPSAALGVAGAKRYVERERRHRAEPRRRSLCGANMNFDRLRFVAERAELGEAARGGVRRHHPGAAGQLQGVLPLRRARATSPSSTTATPIPREAHVFVGRRGARPRREGQAPARARDARASATLDLTDNELAKLHVRHLVGGPRAGAADEMLYRFEFPERPGALMRFLDSMGQGWNISLFHYRNHGADYGRVLAGMQVPPGEKGAFREFLKRLGYPLRRGDGQPRSTIVPRRVETGLVGFREGGPQELDSRLQDPRAAWQ